MKLIKILTLVSMFAVVSIAAGCGKKDKDNKDTAAQKVKPGDVEKPGEPADTSAADTEAGLIISEKLAEVFRANKADCAKLAREIVTFYRANKEAVEKGKKTVTSMTPEAEQAFTAKHAERIAAYRKKMSVAGKCMPDPAVMEAMKVMTPAKVVPAEADPAQKAP
jgi:hypothetical protein